MITIRPKFIFRQDELSYDLYNLPKGFVIKGNLDLSGMGLTALPNLSEVIVMGDFYCYSNNLVSLEGAPKEVKGGFYCHFNNLVSLEGAPKEVKGGFYCHFNKLTSLKGTPRQVGGCVNFSYNKVYSFQYLPRLSFGQYWLCEGNPLKVDDNVPKHVLEHIDNLCSITNSVRTKLIKKSRMLTK